MLRIALGRQLQAGSFEYAINQLVRSFIDLPVFEKQISNDETEAPVSIR